MDLDLIQRSVILTALGSAIFYSIAQSFVLWLFYHVVLVGTTRVTAKMRHNLAAILSAISLALFIITFLAKLLTPTAEITVTSGYQAYSSGSSVATLLNQSATLIPFLSFAYLILLVILVTRWVTSYHKVKLFTRNNLYTAPTSLQEFVTRVSCELRIPRQVHVWISENIEVPATVGFLKPLILVPLSSINNLSTNQLEAILLHELAHIQRHDYLINLLLSLGEIILFFNPFAAFFTREAKRERENCCDDLVLQYRYDALSYASALLALENNRAQMTTLALGAVSGKKQLFTRIKRMNGESRSFQLNNYSRKLVALLAITGLLFGANILLSANFSQTKAKAVVANHVSLDKQDPMVSSVTDVLVNETNDGSIEKDQQENAPVVIGAQSPTDSLKKYNETGKSSVSALESALKIVRARDEGKRSDELEIALEMALSEINKIDWSDVQHQINSSLASMKSELAKSEINQKEIVLQLENLPSLQLQVENIAKRSFNAKIIQRMAGDSLRGAADRIRREVNLGRNLKSVHPMPSVDSIIYNALPRHMSISL